MDGLDRERVRLEPHQSEWRRRYEALKRRLTDEHGDDRAAYTAGKSAFVERVLRRATGD